MATFTAQILIGHGHPNSGGINPTHYAFLSENSRPAWILVSQNIFEEEETGPSKVTWIPTLENMLEDALLMVAIHVCKSHEVVQLGRSFHEEIESDWLELHSALDESHRNELYQKCREITGFPKIVVSVFQGSSIERHLSVIAEYGMDAEVCRSTYARFYSHWANETKILGSLE